MILAQSIKQCKQRFDTYLNFRGSLNNLVTFESDAIYINDSKGKKELVSIMAKKSAVIKEVIEASSNSADSSSSE
jgi:hypothetical protein